MYRLESAKKWSGAGVEPAWTCAQDMWVAATLHPDWWLGTELNRIHWLFRPALCRRVPEPKLVDGARLELAFHGCRPWVIPLYEPPIWGEMRESNSRDWSHNPAPKPFGQSRHRNLELLAGFPPASTCLQGSCLCMSATAAKLWSWHAASNCGRALTCACSSR